MTVEKASEVACTVCLQTVLVQGDDHNIIMIKGNLELGLSELFLIPRERILYIIAQLKALPVACEPSAISVCSVPSFMLAF